MAATDEMLGIARRHRPHAACIVPEKREELTTEGGLDAAGLFDRIQPMVAALAGAGVRVSLCIEPDSRQIDAALRLGAPVLAMTPRRHGDIPGAPRADELRHPSPPRPLTHPTTNEE